MLHRLKYAGGISGASVTDQRRRANILRSVGVVFFGSVHSTLRIAFPFYEPVVLEFLAGISTTSESYSVSNGALMIG
jgi:hypothetical protein